jgi:hypothetical protein
VFSAAKPKQKIFWYGPNDIVLGDSATITLASSESEIDWGYIHLQAGNAGGVVIGSAGTPVYRYVMRHFYLLPAAGKTPAFAFRLISAQEGQWDKGHIESFSSTSATGLSGVSLASGIYVDPAGMSITEEFNNIEFTGNYYNVWFPRGSQDINAWNFKDCLLNNPVAASVMIDIGYGSYSVNGISFTDKTHFELIGANAIGVDIASGIVSGISFKDTYVELLGTGEHVIKAQELASGTPNTLYLHGLIWNGGQIYTASSTPFLFDSSVAGGIQSVSLTLPTVLTESATGLYVDSAVGGGTTVTTNITGAAIWGFDFTYTRVATVASSGANFTDTTSFQGPQTVTDVNGARNLVHPLSSAVTNEFVTYIDSTGQQHLSTLPVPKQVYQTIWFLAGYATAAPVCSATSAAALSVPTWDGSDVVTFPAAFGANGGSITCTDTQGTVTTQAYPSTGGSPQTVTMSTQFGQPGAAWLQLGPSGVVIGGGLVAPALTGQRFLCITTTGIVVSSAAACSGT